MSDLVSILSGAKAVTTTLGLCAFVAGLIAWIAIRKRDVSVYERLLGAGAVRREDIAVILGQFKDDDLRLKALQKVLGGDHDKAKQLLDKAKAVEAIGGVSLSHMAMMRSSLLGIGLILLLLAAIGAIFRPHSGPVPLQQEPQPKAVAAIISAKINSSNDQGPPVPASETAAPVTKPKSPNVETKSPNIELPGFLVKAGGVTYKILKGEASQLSADSSTLKLSVQIVNPGPEPILFSDSLFRVVVDGVPSAPDTVSTSVWIQRESAATGDVTFVIPRSCKAPILRVGHSPQQADYTIKMEN